MARKKKDPFRFIPSEHKGTYRFAIPVVMFFDVIGFTKNTTNEEMKDCIRNIEAAIEDELYEEYNWNEVDEKNQLILVPTGDGYAIAFHPEFKNEKILEIVKKLYCKIIKKIEFSMRMGIAKGPCQVYRDQNEKNNVFGYGINLAHRVMNLACENQILIHEDLANEILRERPHGEIHKVNSIFEIKHGEEIRVYNFYGTHEGKSFGNESDPKDPVNLKESDT